MGEAYAVEDAHTLTQKGPVNKKWHHLPKSTVEDFDEFVPRFKVNEGQLLRYEETEGKNLEYYPSSSISSDTNKETETAIPLMVENLAVTKNVTEYKINITKVPLLKPKPWRLSFYPLGDFD